MSPKPDLINCTYEPKIKITKALLLSTTHVRPWGIETEPPTLI